MILKEVVEESGYVTPVHGKYFLLASNYYRRVGQHSDYYRCGLQFLGCSLDEYPKEEWPQQAFFLGLAALLGDGIYNIGELLAHPILESLNGTENGWIVELLKAFNSGDINKINLDTALNGGGANDIYLQVVYFFVSTPRTSFANTSLREFYKDVHRFFPDPNFEPESYTNSDQYTDSESYSEEDAPAVSEFVHVPTYITNDCLHNKYLYNEREDELWIMVGSGPRFNIGKLSKLNSLGLYTLLKKYKNAVDAYKKTNLLGNVDRPTESEIIH